MILVHCYVIELKKRISLCVSFYWPLPICYRSLPHLALLSGRVVVVTCGLHTFAGGHLWYVHVHCTGPTKYTQGVPETASYIELCDTCRIIDIYHKTQQPDRDMWLVIPFSCGDCGNDVVRCTVVLCGTLYVHVHAPVTSVKG